MAFRPFPRLKALVALLVLCAAAYLARDWWLPAFGYALVHDDGPGKADIAVVLGGDYWGHRVERAGDLVRQGYVPAVLVSGPPGFYGMNEADAAIQFAASKGYPREWFIPLRHEALSTQTEAQAILDELRRRNVHSFLLVTSDFHTARARRIYRAAERARGGPEFRTVAAPDQYFRADSWWRTREGRKTVLIEWMKTIATAIGL